MIYLVSRHPGALQWLLDLGIEPTAVITHWQDDYKFTPNSCVIGNLPLDLIASLSGNNIRYLHINVTIPKRLRGHELTANELRKLGAHLQEFTVFSGNRINSGDEINAVYGLCH